MAVPSTASEQLVRAQAKPLIGGRGFDIVYATVATVFVTGTYLDSWAHNHFRLETFWTPWHGVLYSGVALVLFLLLGVTAINRMRGAGSWFEAIPFGYSASLLGIVGMALDGGLDATWHTLFGIEQNIDALFSPTHLLAMICTALVALGPLRAMYLRRNNPAGFAGHVALTLAFSLFLLMLSNFTQPTHPFILSDIPMKAGSGQDTPQLLAVVSYIFQMALFTGCALYVIRRWKLQFGFFTIVLGLVSVALMFMHDFYLALPMGVISGLLIDTAYLFLRPALERPLSFRLFAAILMGTLPAVLLIGLRITSGPLAWTIHMVAGSVFACAVFGWMLTYLMLPGQTNQREPETM